MISNQPILYTHTAPLTEVYRRFLSLADQLDDITNVFFIKNLELNNDITSRIPQREHSDDIKCRFFDVLELNDDMTCRWSVQTSITALDIWLLQVFSDDIVKTMVKI